MAGKEKILNVLRVFTFIITSFFLKDIFRVKDIVISGLIGGGVIAVAGVLYFILRTKSFKIQIISTSLYCVAILAMAFFFIRDNDELNSESKDITETVNDVAVKESEYQSLIGKWMVKSESNTGVKYLIFTDDSLKIQTNKDVSSYLYACIPNWITTYKNDSVRFVWYVKDVTKQNLILTIDKSEVSFTKELGTF